MTRAIVKPQPGVSAFVAREGRVLLVKRNKKAGYGMWSLPGGHVEPGEKARDAVLRELAEETGVTARVERILDAIDIIHRGEDGEIAFHYLISCFLCRWEAGDPVASDDVSDARWVHPDEFASLAMTPGTADFIRATLSGVSGPA